MTEETDKCLGCGEPWSGHFPCPKDQMSWVDYAEFLRRIYLEADALHARLTSACRDPFGAEKNPPNAEWKPEGSPQLEALLTAAGRNLCKAVEILELINEEIAVSNHKFGRNQEVE